MKDKFEQEVKAMRTIINALEKLDDDSRLRVMKYVVEREDDEINKEPSCGFALAPRVSLSPMSPETIEAGKAVFDTDLGVER